MGVNLILWVEVGILLRVSVRSTQLHVPGISESRYRMAQSRGTLLRARLYSYSWVMLFTRVIWVSSTFLMVAVVVTGSELTRQ